MHILYRLFIARSSSVIVWMLGFVQSPLEALVVLLVLLPGALFAENTIRVEFALQSGGSVHIDFDVDDAHTLSDVYGQVGPFCTRQGLKNEECDTVASFLFAKQYSSSDSPAKTEHSDLVVRDDRCLAQQVVDYCAHHALGLGAECDEVYARLRDQLQLLRDAPAAVTGSCSQEVLSAQQALLSLESLQQHLPHSINTPRSVTVKEESVQQSVNVWVFWSTGAEHMPPLVQYTLFHNRHMAEAYGHRFHLVTLDNLSTYMENVADLLLLLELFPPVQQSDIVRLHLLYTHGGIWLDTDFIIVNDIYALYAVMTDAHASFLATEEFSGKLGNAVLACQPGSPVVAHLLRQVETQLELYAQRREAGLHYMHRDFLGPPLVQEAVQHFAVTVYPPAATLDTAPAPLSSSPAARSVLLVADFTLATMHFAVWHHQPTLHYDLWLRPSAVEAEDIAALLQEASLGIVGLWTLSDRAHEEVIPFWREVVLDDARSVFYQLFFAAQIALLRQTG